MNENSRYIAGIDLGTSTVRCVIASLDSKNQHTIVAVKSFENSGMKKGVVSHLAGPAKAIDDMLYDVETAIGHGIDQASFSINGSHILSTKINGMVPVTSGEVSEDDLRRIKEISVAGKIPANRQILSFIPYSYNLDGQDGISDPYGMRGSRLEVRANVVSAMTPHFDNLHRVAENAQIEATNLIPSVLAASSAVLTEKQKENGVAVIDFGATTTGIAVFEDGDLQYLSVIPLGGVNITNDLAICLKITPEIAEEIKTKHALAGIRENHTDIMVKKGREHYSFNTSQIDEVVEARLEEIFEQIRKEFKKAGCDKQLPSGVVLVGGGANMTGLAKYAKQTLELASQIGETTEESAISEEVKNPEFATAVGLMLEGLKDMPEETRHQKHIQAGGIFAKLFRKIK